MLSKEKQYEIALSLHHYFESLMYVELIRSGRKSPVLEFGPDANSYQTIIKIKKEVTTKTTTRTNRRWRKVPLIHIGIGFFDAEDETDLFWQTHYMLGHETQHGRSTVEKDWKAAHQLCLKDACEKLAKTVLKKSKIRLVKDSDYDNFFQELAKKGVFVNRNMLMDAIHYILNSLEDGRIENIRCRKHPGFAKYRKLFRGKMWMEADLRDADFPEDTALLTPQQRLDILFQDMYFLATCSIHKKGFLAMYGGTDLYDRMHDRIIPEIAAAVISRSCRGCMERGRNIFNELLDEIIESCKCDDDFMQLQEMLKQLLEAISSAIESTYNEDANSEEEGDGIPSESVFGSSDLECEMDEEDLNKMLEQMEEEGDDPNASEMSVKVVVKSKDSDNSDEQEGADGKQSSSDEESDEKSEEDGQEGSSDENASGSNADGKANSGSKEANGGKSGDEKSSDDSSPGSSAQDGNGKAGGTERRSSIEDSNASSSGNPEVCDPKDSSEVNNHDESHSDDEKTENLEEQIKKLMEEAAKAVDVDVKASEADRKKMEEVAKAADGLSPVKPADVDLSGLAQTYYDVTFIENVRVFKPSLTLPFELENKGRSLNNKVEEMIKNKKTPDQRGMRSGSFDASRAHVLLRGELTCYKKRGTYDKPDVAGFILIDNSGSMGNGLGSTRFYACDAAAVIEEGFKGHMPLKIAAFDAYGTQEVVHEVIKEFDESVKPNLSYNFKMLGRSGAGNKDGYSIRVATKQLLARNEKDKILIIMSDGFPTDYSGGYQEGCADVRAAVMEARQAGIKTIGMYMYHDQYEEDFAMYRNMYDPNCIFAGMDDIEKELERVFKKLFR